MYQRLFHHYFYFLHNTSGRHSFILPLTGYSNTSYLLVGKTKKAILFLFPNTSLLHQFILDLENSYLFVNQIVWVFFLADLPISKHQWVGQRTWQGLSPFVVSMALSHNNNSHGLQLFPSTFHKCISQHKEQECTHIATEMHKKHRNNTLPITISHLTQLQIWRIIGGKYTIWWFFLTFPTTTKTVVGTL